MCDLVVVQIFQPLQDLPGVEADGGLVVLQGPPLGPQQGGQAPCTQQDKVSQTTHSLCRTNHLNTKLCYGNMKRLTSRHLLHEDLDESILTDGAQVLDNVLVL